MSMSNNIAEGSGSTSNKEFAQFLNFTRRSSFENANILIILERRNLIKSAYIFLYALCSWPHANHHKNKV